MPQPMQFRAAQSFVLAGAATFTVQSLKTGKHYTFKVVSMGDEEPATRWLVQVLAGPDNRQDYANIGVVRWEGNYPAPKFFLKRDTSPTGASKAFEWVLAQLYDPKAAPGGFAQMALFHEGSCGRCGRALTTPESVSTGLGPVCAGRV